MARVVALIPDLLFGSRVQASLAAAGQEVELIADPARLADRLGDDTRMCDVLVVDLTNPDLDGPALVEALSVDGTLTRAPAVRVLGFYAHVDVTMRERAERAGFDLVVPRSRMSREGPDLVASLISDR